MSRVGCARASAATYDRIAPAEDGARSHSAVRPDGRGDELLRAGRRSSPAAGGTCDLGGSGRDPASRHRAPPRPPCLHVDVERAPDSASSAPAAMPPLRNAGRSVRGTGYGVLIERPASHPTPPSPVKRHQHSFHKCSPGNQRLFLEHRPGPARLACATRSCRSATTPEAAANRCPSPFPRGPVRHQDVDGERDRLRRRTASANVSTWTMPIFDWATSPRLDALQKPQHEACFATRTGSCAHFEDVEIRLDSLRDERHRADALRTRPTRRTRASRVRIALSTITRSIFCRCSMRGTHASACRIDANDHVSLFSPACIYKALERRLGRIEPGYPHRRTVLKRLSPGPVAVTAASLLVGVRIARRPRNASQFPHAVVATTMHSTRVQLLRLRPAQTTSTHSHQRQSLMEPHVDVGKGCTGGRPRHPRRRRTAEPRRPPPAAQGLRPARPAESDAARLGAEARWIGRRVGRGTCAGGLRTSRAAAEAERAGSHWLATRSEYTVGNWVDQRWGDECRAPDQQVVAAGRPVVRNRDQGEEPARSSANMPEARLEAFEAGAVSARRSRASPTTDSKSSPEDVGAGGSRSPAPITPA